MQFSKIAKTSFALPLALLFTGCASTSLDSGPQVVHAIQVGDDMLNCVELQAQIRDSEFVISELSDKIDSSKNMARANDATGTINSYLGKSSLLNNLASSFARQDVSDMQEIRNSHQRRRDVLLQQYMYKECAISTQN